MLLRSQTRHLILNLLETLAVLGSGLDTHWSVLAEHVVLWNGGNLDLNDM